MEIKTYQMIFFYIVLPLLGIGLIIFALFRGRSLGQRPVEIALTKLGLNLKSDTLTLLIILGCVLACIGVFFWYRGYETQVADLKIELEQAKTRINTIDDVLKSFKVYAMRFHLIFPEIDTIDAREIKVQAYISKQGDPPPKLYDTETLVGFSNDIWVKIDNLNPGDKLCIVAYEGEDKSWQSAEIEIPKAHIQMRRVK